MFTPTLITTIIFKAKIEHSTQSTWRHHKLQPLIPPPSPPRQLQTHAHQFSNDLSNHFLPSVCWKSQNKGKNVLKSHHKEQFKTIKDKLRLTIWWTLGEFKMSTGFWQVELFNSKAWSDLANSFQLYNKKKSSVRIVWFCFHLKQSPPTDTKKNKHKSINRLARCHLSLIILGISSVFAGGDILLWLIQFSSEQQTEFCWPEIKFTEVEEYCKQWN